MRQRGKIEAAIRNAAAAQKVVDEFGSLAAYFWRFEPDPAALAAPQTASTHPKSVALASDLKKRGWVFVGPTTAHAFMQAMGLVNDHELGCHARAKVAAAREGFRVPG